VGLHLAGPAPSHPAMDLKASHRATLIGSRIEMLAPPMHMSARLRVCAWEFL